MKTVEEVARGIEEEAFDAWCFDKTTKQYQGVFFPDECKAIIRADREALLRRVEKEFVGTDSTFSEAIAAVRKEAL